MNCYQTLSKLTLAAAILLGSALAWAYPPAVGILSKAPACTACHVSNGPWTDESQTIIDILDATTKRSLRSEDGSFLIEAHRGELKTVLTVIGCTKECAAPLRNAWLYVDPEQIATSGLSKFAPGWDVNLPMACRIVVGDTLAAYPDAHITVLPMTVRPMDAARDAALNCKSCSHRTSPSRARPRKAWYRTTLCGPSISRSWIVDTEKTNGQRLLIGWWLARDPNGSNTSLVEGKRLTFDLSAAQPIRVQ